MRFEVYCLFDQRKVTASAILNFLTETVNILTPRTMSVLPTPDSTVWERVEEISIDKLKETLERVLKNVPEKFHVYFDDPENNATHDSKIRWIPRLYFYWPDELLIGADSETFYTGSRAEDRRRVNKIVDLTFLALDQFGDAIAEYGADGWVEEEVYELRKNGEPANLTAKSNKNEWVEKILKGNYAAADIELGLQ